MPRPAPYDPKQHPYPKRIYLDQKVKKGITVNSKEEEDAAIAAHKKDDAPKVVSPPEPTPSVTPRQAKKGPAERVEGSEG
jgi:hypothetical protein